MFPDRVRYFLHGSGALAVSGQLRVVQESPHNFLPYVSLHFSISFLWLEDIGHVLVYVMGGTAAYKARCTDVSGQKWDDIGGVLCVTFYLHGFCLCFNAFSCD